MKYLFKAIEAEALYQWHIAPLIGPCCNRATFAHDIEIKGFKWE
jgi:hypothetical protein